MNRTRADALFERFRESGDPRALAKVFDLTAAQIFRVAAWLCRDRHRAEDLVQSTFLSAIEHAGRFEPGRAVLPWLLGILANHARMTQREDVRRAERERRQAPATSDPAAEAEIHELAESLERSLHGLSEPYRQVLLLHLQHGLSAKEIAQVLQRPAGTVRTQVVRGLELLRSALPAGFVAGSLLVATPGHGLAMVRAAVLESVTATAPAAIPFPFLGGLLLMKKSFAVLAVLLLAGAGLFVKFSADAPPESSPSPLAAASHDAAAGRPETRPLVPVPAHAADVPSSRRAIETPSRDPLPPGKAGLLVRVRWGDDQTPAENVLVYASPASAGEDRELRITHERSSAAGEVRFTDLAPGKLELEADRGGKLSLELRPGEWQEAGLEIPVGVTVTGTVVDAGRKPVAGARIWVSSPTWEVTPGVELASTDAAGRFRLRSVEPDRFVSALATGRVPAPGRRIPRDAKDTVDLTLQVGDRSATIRGLVYGPDEQPLPAASVVVGIARRRIRVRGFPDGDNSLHLTCFVRTNARGEFAADGFALQPSVPVWVRAPGCAVWKQDVTVRESEETFVTVRLQHGASVTGTVHNGAGAPVKGARVTAAQQDIEPPKDVMLSGPSWAQPWSNTDAEGRFTLAHLLPGRIKLRAQEEQEWAATSFDLADGQQSVWNVVLGSGLSIAGTVTDSREAPLPGWTVWAEGGQGVARAGQVVTGPDGTFRLAGCEDALYTVSARDGKSAMHGAAASVKEVVPGADPVHIIVPDEQLPTCKVSGILLDPDAKPVRSASLYLALMRIGAAGNVATAGGKPHYEGDRFVVGPFTPGTYDVSLSLDQATVARLGEHRLTAGETLDLGSIRMQKPGFVRLTVKNVEGEPLAAGMFMLQAAGTRIASGDVLFVASGTARSKPTQPGSYRVTSRGGQFVMWSRDVLVRSDEETAVEVTLQRGVRRQIRYPTVRSEHTTILLTWKRGSEIVFQNASMMSNTEAPHVSEDRFVPGTYEVEVRDIMDNAAKATLVVDDREESAEIFELPYPATLRK